MAHFAQLDGLSNVVAVVVVSNSDITDGHGREHESLGIALCEEMVGPGPWVQTSYNNSLRRRYAGIKMTYSAEHDAFLLPQPYPSWTLDLNNDADWVAPTPMPTDEGYWYEWDEGTQTWTAHEILEPEQP